MNSDLALKTWNQLVVELGIFFDYAPVKKAIVGLSRGFDSTMVAALAAEAIGGENVLGVAMPSVYSADQDLRESRALADHLGIRFESVRITSIYNETLKTLAQTDPVLVENWSVVQENLQARIRANILMALSNAGKGLVLNTGNLSERKVGYFTLYGDSIGSVGVLGNLYKSDLWDIARAKNAAEGREVIPNNIIEAAPTAELAPGQSDEESLTNYYDLDTILRELREVEIILRGGDVVEHVALLGQRLPKHIDTATIVKIVNLVRKNRFKSQSMPYLLNNWKA